MRKQIVCKKGSISNPVHEKKRKLIRKKLRLQALKLKIRNRKLLKRK